MTSITSKKNTLKSVLTVAFLGLVLVATGGVAVAQDAPDDTLNVESAARQATQSALARHLAEGRTAADVPAAQRAAVPNAKMTGFVCLPTCDETDAKFLALAGTNRVTLSDQVLELQVSAPAGSSSFLLGFFDGDGSRPTEDPPNSGNFTTRWDSGAQTVYRYTLFADPMADGTGTVVIPLSGQPSVLSTAMLDSGWSDFTVNVLPTGDPAASPSGNLFYTLRIEVVTPPAPPAPDDTINVFKVRATGQVSIRFNQQPFSYMAGFGTALADAITIYPGFPDLSTTNYDGEFSFFIDADISQSAIEIWNGDFDYGSQDGVTDRDTDDANSPNTVPSFAPAGSGATAEGVAVGLGSATGDPPDDANNILFVRPPSVVLDVLTPAFQTFSEPNPSGNREWELFLLATTPGPNPDFVVPNLPAGAYEVRARGVDLVNLNALRLPFQVLCVDPLGDACEPLRMFLVGDTVFTDVNGDGIQDPGDTGIPGVIVNLLDDGGNFVATTTTDGNGEYTFEVDAGQFTVEIDPANFVGAGVLSGRTSTTGGETITDTVVDDNVLTYDFGYNAPADGSIGDFVWFDDNRNAIDDEPAMAGINGVIVNLFDGGGMLIDTQVTDANGAYLFTGLAPGNYTVDVDDTTLPGGFLTTTFNDPLAVMLGVSEAFLDADFGYNFVLEDAQIGDRVWNDLDGDGIQDIGEPGIDNVTVNLTGDIDGDGLPDVFRTVNTIGGFYVFDDLPPGSYTVTVDDTTLPAGFDPTFDLDGLGTPHTASLVLGPSDIRSDVDFGYGEPAANDAALGDRVWFDTDGDGVQDAGEAGINGVNIFLFDGGGGLVGFTTTAGDGDYAFTDLAAGTYQVAVDTSTLPPGVVPTFDFDGITTPHIATVTLAESEVNNDVDFGYADPDPGDAALGDRVWNDIDGDGVQDAGELGFNGVTVNLLDAGGNLIASQMTSGDGNYAFTGLVAGTYTVEVDASTLPSGSNPTFDFDGIATANTAQVTLAPSEVNNDVDFGYNANGALGDRVWLDQNGDGVQDTGENGINGVTVELLDAGGTVIASQMTSGDGNYNFGNLFGGDYTVRIDVSTLPAGVVQTFDLDGTLDDQTSVTLGAGEMRTDLDFGYRGNGSLGDRVWRDDNGDGIQDAGEPGLNGVTVNLRDAGGAIIATTVTSGDGDYSFDNLIAGTYTVEVDASTLPPGNNPTFDFDGIGTANVATVTLGAGETNNDIDFGYNANGSLGDRVWLDFDGDGVQDAGENGINGVTVELRDDVGNVIATQMTSGDGNYTFGNLFDGDYTVAIDVSTLPAGLVQTFDLDGTLDDETTVTLAGGAMRTDVDFGYRGTASIGDRVWNDTNGDGVQDVGEAGINGLLVELLDAGGNVIATTTTSGDGNYTFSGLPAGDFTVRVSPRPGDAQTFDLDGVLDNQTTVTLAGGETRDDVDFGYRGTGSIGDRVWNDLDGDGAQDAGEPGINGVLVELLDAGGNVVATATTAGDGNYTFGNLDAGDYTVRVTQPAGFDPTFDLDGVLDNQTMVTLAAGETRTDVDFGYREPVAQLGAIGDRVWNDLNGDGIQDAGEPGINGVPVELLVGGVVVATSATAGDGIYGFVDLAPGDYTVRVDISAFSDLVQTFDLDGTLDNQTTLTLGAGEVRDDVDFGYEGDPQCIPDIAFQTSADGVALTAGQIIDDEFAAFGISVTTDDPVNHPAMIFDTANPTGGDTDLGTPNQDFGGPGVGAGGAAGQPGQNDTALGNVLIISEDGDSGDPDDNGAGGTLIFTFDRPARVDEVVILDIDEGMAGDIVGFDAAGDMIGTAAMSDILGDNSVQTVNVGLRDVSRLEIIFPGSGAVAAINFCVEDEPCTPKQFRDDFNVTSFSNNDGTDNWSGPWLEVDPQGAGPASGNVKIAGGFLKLDDNPNTGAEPGVRREADLSGAFTATLRFDFDTSDGVDADDAVTVDISRDGGATWTTLEVFTGITGALWDDREFDITPFISSQTQVRLRVTNKYGGNDETFFVNYLEIVTTCDGNTLFGAIGDRVWHDLDGDGNQDAGEPGINGVTVELLDSVGNVIATAITSGDGDYGFGNLFAGDYTVRVDDTTLPAGFVPTSDADGVSTPNVTDVTLGNGQVRNDIDFGYGDEGDFCPSAAINDPTLNSEPAHHAFWLPGISEDLVFRGDRSFQEFADGTARLTGTVFDRFDDGQSFDVVVDFSGLSVVAPAGSPKRELDASAYSENGGPIDTDTWRYYTTFTGTLAGMGDWSGAEISITRTGAAFQVGDGANGKNLNFGASAWFDWTVVQQPSGGGFPSTGRGDINIDLDEGACPPDPNGCTPKLFRDDFNQTSYSNNDGNDDWSGPWIEVDPQGAGPGSGNVKIAGGFLKLDDNPNTGSKPGVRREADLSGAATATLRFDFDTSDGVDSSDAVTVDVSDDGGATWTVLEVITGISGSVWADREFDITPFISSETQVRLRVTNLYGGNDETFFVNYLEISTTCDPGNPGGDFCPRTPGFWKNHPNDWPVDTLELGGVSYNMATLLDFLRYGGPDASLKLARSLVATKLNLLSGSDPAIQSVVDDADDYLVLHPPGSDPQGSARSEGNALKDLLDAYNNTPCNESAPSALLVVGSTSLNAGDAAVRNRLVGMGYLVDTVSGPDSVTGDANGRRMVVISSTVYSGDVNTKFRDVPVSVVVWESHLFDDMGMTGAASGSDYGTVADQTQVDIVLGASFNLSTMTGTTTFTSSPQRFTWGIPNGNAYVVARRSGSSSRAAIFGYQEGAAMPGLDAPARRIGLSLNNDTPASLSADGWAIFDAAIDWASER